MKIPVVIAASLLALAGCKRSGARSESLVPGTTVADNAAAGEAVADESSGGETQTGEPSSETAGHPGGYSQALDNPCDPPLWDGRAVPETLVDELLARFRAQHFSAFLGHEDNGAKADGMIRLLSEITIASQSVSCLVPPLDYDGKVRYDGSGDNPFVSLRLSPSFVGFMAALPDTALERIKAHLDKALKTPDSLRHVIERFILAKDVLEIDVSLFEACQYVGDAYFTLGGMNLSGFLSQVYNDSLVEFIATHRDFFAFWIERRSDKSYDSMDKLLNRMVRRFYPETIQLERLKQEARSLFLEPRPDTPLPAGSAVFFDTNTFIDPSIPPGVSRLDIRKKIIRTHLTSVIRGIAEWKLLPIESDSLSAMLFHSGSKYFRPDLEYRALFRNPARDSYAWETITLSPKLLVGGYAWDDNVYDIAVQLRVYPNHPQKIPILFAAMPAQKKPNPTPTAVRAATRLSRKVDAIQDSMYCRRATETYAPPKDVKTVRSMFTTTFYWARFGPSSSASIHGDSLEGQDNDGLVFANTGKSEKGIPDTTANMLIQYIAGLYLITPSQDTVLLHSDTALSGFGDGETMYKQAARCRNPVFLDANDDQIEDLLFESSIGQVLMLGQRDGRFKRERF